MFYGTPSYRLGTPGTYPTILDLTQKQGYACKKSSGNIVLCDSQGERIFGIIGESNEIDTAQHGVEVHLTPGTTVVARAGANGVTAGSEVTVGTDSKFENAGSADIVVGRCSLISGASFADGEFFSLDLENFYVKA